MKGQRSRAVSAQVFYATVSSIACVTFATSVHAQTSDAPAVENGQQQEIIVTAERRAQRLETIPASIAVVTQEALQATGITRFQDLGHSVPGLQIARTGIFTQPSIRGISTLITGGGFENNIAYYMDGFYESNPLATNGDLTNLKSVEVLKGPQGTLYGRNASGGAILVNTLDPTSELSGSVTAEYGTFNNQAYSGYLSGQIVQGVSASVVGYSRRSDGYVRDIGGFNSAKFKNSSVRVKVKLDPVDWASITLAYNRMSVDDPRGAVYVEYDNRPAGYVGSFARDTSSLTFAPTAVNIQNQYRMTGVFTTPIGKLTTRTGYSRTALRNDYDFDGQPADLLRFVSRNLTTTFQQAVDLNIDVIPRASILIGGLYYHDMFKNTRGEGYAGGVNYTAATGQIATDAIALYADGTYNVTDRLFLTAGARYNRESKEMLFATLKGAVANTITTPARKTFQSVTPRASIRYEIDTGMNIYASFSQGFKSGTYNTSAVPPNLVAPIKDEQVTAYEVGFKGVSGPWRWEMAAYTYDYRDLQIATTQIVNGLLVQVTGNANKAHIYGAEAQLSYSPTERWNIGAALAYNHARYTDVKNAVGTGVNPTTGLNSTAVQDWTGLVMVRAPAWTANIHASYNFPFLSGTATLTGNLSYSSRFIPNNPSTFETTTTPPNLNKAQRFWSPGYTLINLQASWSDASDHFTLTAFANNVTNDRYLLTNSGATYGSYRQFNEPRTYGARVGYKF